MDELSSVENKSNLLYIDRGLSSLMSAKNVSGGNSSSSESACSINFLPLLPKSSSGHSSASTESSSSSSTSSAAAVAVVMSAAMNNSSSSSSSSPSPPKSPLKHNNHHNHQSQMNSPFILNAFVNGFVQLKLCADKIDYAYIIEIYWSNESRSFVKRTFDDFVEFHARFLTEFADFFSSSTSSAAADSRTSPLHHISPTVQRKKPPPPPLNDSKSKFFNFAAKPVFELIPVLPVAKKRFWMSQLKLAESREIELNNYVQHLLKLPTNISHSAVVIKFFESQSSDPKPAGSYFHKSEVDDYEEERDDFDEDDEDEVNSSSLNNSNYADDELTRCQQRISSISNHNSSSSSDEEDDENDEDDEDDDDDRPHINLPHSAILSSDYSGRLSALSSSHYSTGGGLRNLRKKSSNKQSSLWWDEDNALNELTTSISTEFGSQFNLNNNNSNNQKFGVYKIECDEATTTTCNKLEDDEEEEDIQTLKTLDNMIKTSELFNDETPSSN